MADKNHAAIVQLNPADIIKEGFCNKQGGRIKTWKYRLCVLTKEGLSYFKIEQNVKNKYQNQQGKIELETIDSVEQVPEKEKLKYPNCFKVVTKPRTYIISASSQSEMTKWITAINDARQKFAKGSASSSAYPTSSTSPSIKINPEIESKGIPELEQMLGGIDSKMNDEIKVLLDDYSKDKDMILYELTRRDTEMIKAQWLSERQQLSNEIRRRQTFQ